MAYPSKRTVEVEQAILSRMSRGEPLAQICREEGMPTPTTWREWCRSDQALDIAHGHAREDGFDAIAANVRLIAREGGDSSGDVQRDKLMIETDLKLLAKWDPKRYGDKIDVTSGGDKLPTTTINVAGLSEATLREIAAQEAGS